MHTCSPASIERETSSSAGRVEERSRSRTTVTWRSSISGAPVTASDEVPQARYGAMSSDFGDGGAIAIEENAQTTSSATWSARSRFAGVKPETESFYAQVALRVIRRRLRDARGVHPRLPGELRRVDIRVSPSTSRTHRAGGAVRRAFP